MITNTFSMPDPTIPTPTASPTISTDSHRATPAQWAALHLVDPFGDTAACVLELRARVEALEAAANNRQHSEAAERAEPDPAASLVVRVANAIYESTSLDLEDEGRAAIREVAAWLRENDAESNMGGDAAATADLLDKEASR